MSKNKFITVLMLSMCLILGNMVTVFANDSVIIRDEAVHPYNIKTLRDLRNYPQSEVPLEDAYMPITVEVVDKDGNVKRISDNFKYECKIMKDHTAIALTDFANNMDIQVNWFAKERVVVLGDIDQFREVDGESYTKLIYIPIMRDLMQIDTVKKALPVPAMIDKATSKTYLPLRAIAEIMNYEVSWDGNSFTATLTEIE